MQNLKSLPLLDALTPQAPATKNLLQTGTGETANRFNQLLKAVQTGAAENSDTSEIATTGNEVGFKALRLLAGTADNNSELPQTDGAIVADGVKTEANASSALGNSSGTSTLPDVLTNVDSNTLATGTTSISEPAQAGETTVAAELTHQSETPQVPAVGMPQSPNTNGVAALPAGTTTAPSISQYNPAWHSEPTALQAQPTVTNPPIQANTKNVALGQFAQPNSTSGTQGQSAVVQTQTSAPPVAANFQLDNNTTLAVAQKQQSAGLTPQTQITAPPQAAFLAAAAPIATVQTDATKPQSTAPKGAAALHPDLTASGRAAEPTDTPRPTVPSELQKSALPGALTAAVDPKVDGAGGAKSVWQIANDAQPAFPSKPAGSALAAAPEIRAATDIPEALSRTPADALPSTTTPGRDLSNTTSAQAAANKAPVSKPFSEALMMQVKAAEVADGRTSVHLHPRGLGNIDVEIIAGEKDLASKVIVRVENPLILQHLRDDRHLLAQAIGVTDGSIFEFHERGAEQQGGQSQNGQAEFTDTSSESAEVAATPRHADVLADDRIDILT